MENQWDQIEQLEESIKEQKATYLAEKKRTIEDTIEETIGEIARALGQVGKNPEGLQAAWEEKTSLVTRLEWELRIKEAELARIHNSQGWKILSMYYRLRDSILPHYVEKTGSLQKGTKGLCRLGAGQQIRRRAARSWSVRRRDVR